MNPFLRPGRVVAAIALGATVLLSAAPAASAHAGIESSSPKNGAQLMSAPRTVALTFAEPIKLDGTGSRLIDQNGATVPSVVKAKGQHVTFSPRSPLAAGRYAAAWHLISADGDAVEGAITFTIATRNPKGAAQVIATKPRVPTTLDGTLPGSRTLTLITKGTSGDVEWTSARLPEELVWEIAGDGTKAKATGVLPWAGVWSFTATVTDAQSHVVIVKGTVTLKG
jgi:methionine-rich copper-binding protein CopC